MEKENTAKENIPQCFHNLNANGNKDRKKGEGSFPVISVKDGGTQPEIKIIEELDLYQGKEGKGAKEKEKSRTTEIENEIKLKFQGDEVEKEEDNLKMEEIERIVREVRIDSQESEDSFFQEHLEPRIGKERDYNISSSTLVFSPSSSASTFVSSSSSSSSSSSISSGERRRDDLQCSHSHGADKDIEMNGDKRTPEERRGPGQYEYEPAEKRSKETDNFGASSLSLPLPPSFSSSSSSSGAAAASSSSSPFKTTTTASHSSLPLPFPMAAGENLANLNLVGLSTLTSSSLEPLDSESSEPSEPSVHAYQSTRLTLSSQTIETIFAQSSGSYRMFTVQLYIKSNFSLGLGIREAPGWGGSIVVSSLKREAAVVGPAEEAGVRLGDVIVGINYQSLKNVKNFVSLLYSYVNAAGNGNFLHLTIMRDLYLNEELPPKLNEEVLGTPNHIKGILDTARLIHNQGSISAKELSTIIGIILEDLQIVHKKKLDGLLLPVQPKLLQNSNNMEKLNALILRAKGLRDSLDIRILFARENEINKFVYICLVEDIPTGVSWQVSHRYKEFHELYMKLKDIFPPLAQVPFPGRRLVSSTNPFNAVVGGMNGYGGKKDLSQIESRMESLELFVRTCLGYLQSVATVNNKCAEALLLIQDFFYVSHYVNSYRPPLISELKSVEVKAFLLLQEKGQEYINQNTNYSSTRLSRTLSGGINLNLNLTGNGKQLGKNNNNNNGNHSNRERNSGNSNSNNNSNIPLVPTSCSSSHTDKSREYLRIYRNKIERLLKQNNNNNNNGNSKKSSTSTANSNSNSIYAILKTIGAYLHNFQEYMESNSVELQELSYQLTSNIIENEKGKVKEKDEEQAKVKGKEEKEKQQREEQHQNENENKKGKEKEKEEERKFKLSQTERCRQQTLFIEQKKQLIRRAVRRQIEMALYMSIRRSLMKELYSSLSTESARLYYIIKQLRRLPPEYFSLYSKLNELKSFKLAISVFVYTFTRNCPSDILGNMSTLASSVLQVHEEILRREEDEKKDDDDDNDEVEDEEDEEKREEREYHGDEVAAKKEEDTVSVEEEQQRQQKQEGEEEALLSISCSNEKKNVKKMKEKTVEEAKEEQEQEEDEDEQQEEEDSLSSPISPSYEVFCRPISTTEKEEKEEKRNKYRNGRKGKGKGEEEEQKQKGQGRKGGKTKEKKSTNSNNNVDNNNNNNNSNSSENEEGRKGRNTRGCSRSSSSSPFFSSFFENNNNSNNDTFTSLSFDNPNASTAMSADDFFPLFTYIMIHGAPSHLYLIKEILLSLVDPAESIGEGGYYTATLEAAIHHALELYENYRNHRPLHATS